MSEDCKRRHEVFGSDRSGSLKEDHSQSIGRRKLENLIPNGNPILLYFLGIFPKPSTGGKT